MLGLVITTDDKMYKKEFGRPLFQTISDVIGGFEIVTPVGLPRPFCFMVDDKGVWKDLPVNHVGTAWYDALPHKIHGDIVVMKKGWTVNGPDVIGLTEEECKTVINLVYEMTDESVRMVKEPDKDPEHVVL